jgi:hypothetical protein
MGEPLARSPTPAAVSPFLMNERRLIGVLILLHISCIYRASFAKELEPAE